METNRRALPNLSLMATASIVLAACSDLALEPAQTPGRFEITPDNALAQEGEPFKFSLKVYDEDGEEMPGPPSWAPAQWFPADPSAVFVHPDGTADLLGGGNVRILARLADLEATVRLRINPSQVRLSTARVYLNQGAQNQGGTVPVVAGRAALLRVFAVGNEISYYYPKVRATFYVEDEEVFAALMTAAGESTPDRIIEAGLEMSYNAVVPASVVRPGLQVVVDLDVDGDVPAAPGTELRFPAEGRFAFDVREPNTLRQIFVPTLLTMRNSEESVLEWSRDLAAESDKIAFMRKSLPVGDLDVEVREEPYVFTGDLTEYEPYWGNYLDEISVLQVLEGRRGYYYGVVTRFSGIAIGGLGWIGQPASVGITSATTYAHELGHNMSLLHAPCGNPANVDDNYPSSYVDGSIGIWGWDIEAEEQREPARYKDLMTYCGPEWVSDYSYAKALNFRLDSEPARISNSFCWETFSKRDQVKDHCPSQSTLLLWGRTDPGAFRLEPAFVVETQPALPQEAGPYRLAAFGEDGALVFAYDFASRTNAEGGAGFTFAVPYDPDRDGKLDRVALSGPGGSYTLGRSTAAPMAMIRNPETGLVRSFVRDWRGDLPAFASGALDIVVSEGLSWSSGR